LPGFDKLTQRQPACGWPLHGGVRCIKKSLHGFFYDCRIALQFCTLLSRHPWLDVGWQERLKNPSMDFLNDCRSRELLHAAKPPSMA